MPHACAAPSPSDNAVQLARSAACTRLQSRCRKWQERTASATTSADQNMRTQNMRCDMLECSRCTPRMKKQRLVHRKLAQSCVPYTSLACRRRSRSVQLDGEHQEDERPEHQNRRRRASTFWIGTRQDVDWQPAAAGSLCMYVCVQLNVASEK